MLQPDIAAVADAIVQARQARRPADALAFADHLQSEADSYAVQALVAKYWPGADSTFPRHWKSGGPSREAQLTHAPLPFAGVWRSPAVAGNWPFTLRLIEAEIALRLGRDVTPQQAAASTHEAATSLIDAMAVSIEIVDSRWQQGPAAPALLKLADLQSHGALVLGEWVPFIVRNWSAQTCAVRIGDGTEKQFCGTHSLADPGWLLPIWLRHATRDGNTVPAGTVVTTGTWCGMLAAALGDRVVVRFDGVGEAAVQL